MPAKDVQLTPGSVKALKRLKNGAKLEQEDNRSLIRWTTGKREAFHHLTFKNLSECGALKKVSGRSGYTTYGITKVGESLGQ